MIPFYSEQHQVYPALREGRAAVEKHFSSPDDCRQEAERYAMLRDALPLPALMETTCSLLVSEYLPYSSLRSELDRQGAEGFSPLPWQALAQWLQTCHTLCGLLPAGDVLDHFLWDSAAGRIFGLGLGRFRPCSLSDCGAALVAEVLGCGAPAGAQAAALLAQRLQVSDRAVQAAASALRERRVSDAEPLSGIILAGGPSRRMGQNKAALPLLGKPLLLHQIEKLQALGIEDILLSGADCPDLPGTRTIPDVYPGRGPLSGLHACLQAAKHPRCLVLGVDIPLVPLSVLDHLRRAHTGGATVLRHISGLEPLVGVYDRALAELIPPLIEQGGAPVRALQNVAAWRLWDYVGPEELLLNCNTPEDYARIEVIAKQFADLNVRF